MIMQKVEKLIINRLKKWLEHMNGYGDKFRILFTNKIRILKEENKMNTETIILLIDIVISLIIGFIGGFFIGAYWKTK